MALAPPVRAAELEPSPAADAAGWYQPLAEDFRPWYEADAANQAKQEWGETWGYWYWVRVFYDTDNCGRRHLVCLLAKLRTRGWTSVAGKITACPDLDPGRSAELRHLLNQIGWYIAAEWSKDNAVRRISTGDLRTWSRRSRRACGRGGEAVFEELTSVSDRIAQRLPEAATR